jgi:hypothetical protein
VVGRRMRQKATREEGDGREEGGETVATNGVVGRGNVRALTIKVSTRMEQRASGESHEV